MEIKQRNTTVDVPDLIKERISRVVSATILRAQIELGYRPLLVPSVLYTLRGTTAGWARGSTNTININSILLIENVEQMINEIVPHEVAHLIARQVYGPKIKPHGAEWKSVMVCLGKKPTRCHPFDTTRSQVRRKASFKYECGCEKGAIVGPTVHKRIQGGSMHLCRTCRTYLSTVPYSKEA